MITSELFQVEAEKTRKTKRSSIEEVRIKTIMAECCGTGKTCNIEETKTKIVDACTPGVNQSRTVFNG